MFRNYYLVIKLDLVTWIILCQLFLIGVYGRISQRRPILGRNPLQTEDINNLITLFIDAENEDGEYELVQNDEEKGNELVNCNTNDDYAIIVHGWRESCNTLWVTDLVENLRNYRGGCIMCFDFSRYQARLSDRYRPLVNNFKIIASALTETLFALEEIGFNPDNAFLFGFSYGARLVVQAAAAYGNQLIARIDVCDPARPIFDNNKRRIGLIDPTTAAKNVQCIHTSTDKGTTRRNCHQDWIMGECGKEQPAAGDPPFGNHGLCPHFYNSAFEHNFKAILKPRSCSSNREVVKYPKDYIMGYMENRTSLVRGDLFALTSKQYPYNVE